MQYPCAFGYERGRKVREPTNKKKLFYSHSSIQFKRFAKYPVDHRRKKMELCCCHGTDCFFAEKYFFQRIVSEIHLYLKI